MQNKIEYKGEQFCFMNCEWWLMTKIQLYLGTCKINLEAISKAEHVFGDETFTYAAKNVMQLYTLYIYKNNYYIPVVYFFLRNKQTLRSTD